MCLRCSGKSREVSNRGRAETVKEACREEQRRTGSGARWAWDGAAVPAQGSRANAEGLPLLPFLRAAMASRAGRPASLPPSLSPCFSPCPLSPSLSLLPACLSPPSPSSGPKLSQPQLFTSCSAGVPAIKSKPLWNASHWSAHARRIHVAYAPSSRASSSTKLTELCCVPGTVLDAGGSQQ